MNTINLQFLTPVILFLLTLLDFNKLKGIYFVLINILAFICITNGVLSFVILPLFCYKLIRNGYRKWAAFLLLLFGMLNIAAAFAVQGTQLESFSSRFDRNLDYKISAFQNGGILAILKNSFYIYVLPPFIILSFYVRSKAFYYFVATLVLAIFMDFTTLIPPIHSRYEILIAIFTVISIIVLIKEYRHGHFIAAGLAVFVFVKYAPKFYETDVSHDNSTKKWKTEYKNLIVNKKAFIYPNNHIVNLEK